jgi:hypothetical protein
VKVQRPEAAELEELLEELLELDVLLEEFEPLAVNVMLVIV